MISAELELVKGIFSYIVAASNLSLMDSLRYGFWLPQGLSPGPSSLPYFTLLIFFHCMLYLNHTIC